MSQSWAFGGRLGAGRYACAVALMLAVLQTPVAAQTTNAVRENYQAYTAALERGDLDAAEVAARAALAASEARDGDGGSTAVLALNLAHVLLERGNTTDAVAPARRAQDLALNAGAGSRVDPLVAGLAVRRAELPTMVDQAAEPFWFELLSAHEGGVRNEAVYDAAADFGAWASGRDNFDLSARAWRVASEASPGDEPDAILARAAALRSLGAALLLRDIARNRTVEIASVTRRADHNEADTSPMEPLIEAVRISRPLAAAQTSHIELTNAQQQFSLSLALLNAARSRLGAMNGWSSTVGAADWSQLGGISLAPAGQGAATLCAMSLTMEPRLRYPREAQNRYGVGAVVMRFVFAPDGAVLLAEPIATAGGEAFAVAARRVRWTAERSENAAPNCTVPAVSLRSILFTFGD